MLGSITASGQQDLIKIGEDLGGIEPETCRIWGLGPGAWCPFGWMMVARCAFFGLGFWCAVRRFWGGFWCAVRRFWAGHVLWCAVCGAPILGPISVHGASFFWARFWCAVRRFWAGFWCAVCGAPILGADFSARCVVFRLAVRRFWAGIWCAVCGAPILGPISVQRCVALVFGLDFGARCAVFGLDFGARCVVRRFWGRFQCNGASFLGSLLVRGAPFLGSILVRGVWCADFGADFVATVRLFRFDFGALCAVFVGSILVAWCAGRVGFDHSAADKQLRS